jgi:hypothetical protein
MMVYGHSIVITCVLFNVPFELMKYNGIDRTEWNKILFHCLDLKKNNGMERDGIEWNKFHLIPPYTFNFVLLFLKIFK